MVVAAMKECCHGDLKIIRRRNRSAMFLAVPTMHE
jgi:hypothetical protein